MTIINTARADVPVIIIDQGRLTDDLGSIKFDENEAKLHLCGIGANVAEVIRATALSRLFPVHRNVASALRTI